MAAVTRQQRGVTVQRGWQSTLPLTPRIRAITVDTDRLIEGHASQTQGAA